MTTVLDSVSDFISSDYTEYAVPWSEDSVRDLLRAVRLTSVYRAVEERSSSDEESEDDILHAVRVFHEVLVLNPAARMWPLFAGPSCRSSLFKSAVLHVEDQSELYSLSLLTERGALVAANLARWMLRLPQQNSPTVVFTAARPPRIPAPRTPVREVAVA